jgi:hypothetical protein
LPNSSIARTVGQKKRAGKDVFQRAADKLIAPNVQLFSLFVGAPLEVTRQLTGELYRV